MLLFLVGPPRSGKSTFSQKWLNFELTDDHIQEYRPRVIVNGDSIRKAVTGFRWNSNSELLTHPIKIYMIKALLDVGHDVLVDDTHTTRYSVQQLWDVDNTAKFVIIDTEKEECRNRAVKTGQMDVVPVIERTWPQYNSLKTLLLNHYKHLNYLEGYNVYRSISP